MEKSFASRRNDKRLVRRGKKLLVAKNVEGYNEGISCLACHSIQKTDIQGNANYTMVQRDGSPVPEFSFGQLDSF
ncbi:MAG TPA: hypothetical protein VF740_07560 [Candidatus Acidoferrum sp.]